MACSREAVGPLPHGCRLEMELDLSAVERHGVAGDKAHCRV